MGTPVAVGQPPVTASSVLRAMGEPESCSPPRPLWKWFPAFDDRDRMTDSLIWMWHGSYYYTASLHGDRMVGWHVNHPDVGGTPSFQPLERYKHLFLKPAAIAKLLSTRSVAEALKEAAGGNVLRRSFREVEPAPVELGLGQTVVRGNVVNVNVAVNALGNNPDLLLDRGKGLRSLLLGHP